MTIRVKRSPKSLFDFAAIVEYLLGVAAIAAADRFSSAYDETLDFIRQFPDLGEALPEIPTRSGLMRRMPIRGFPSFLVYFRRDEEYVTVIRILHGSRQVDLTRFWELPS